MDGMRRGKYFIGSRPKFSDFLKFLTDRATLVNNEFGEDLTSSSSKEKESAKQRDQRGRVPERVTTLAAGVQGQQRNSRKMNRAMPACAVCHGQYGLLRSDKFNNQSQQERWKVVHYRNKAFVSSVSRVVT